MSLDRKLDKAPRFFNSSLASSFSLSLSFSLPFPPPLSPSFSLSQVSLSFCNYSFGLASIFQGGLFTLPPTFCHRTHVYMCMYVIRCGSSSELPSGGDGSSSLVILDFLHRCSKSYTRYASFNVRILTSPRFIFLFLISLVHTVFANWYQTVKINHLPKFYNKSHCFTLKIKGFYV